MAELSVLETLRVAAQRLRDLAAAAVPGPWISINGGDRVLHPVGSHGDFEYVVDEPMSSSANAAWIATMSPAVAESLAAQLDYEAAEAAYWGDGYDGPDTRNLVAFARIILDDLPLQNPPDDHAWCRSCGDYPEPAEAVDRRRSLAAYIRDLSYAGRQLDRGHAAALAAYLLSGYRMHPKGEP